MNLILIIVFLTFDKRVAPSVARSVAKAAMESGVARIEVNPQDIYDKTMKVTDLK